MIPKVEKSTITSKKQQFRRQIRAQYLHNYMRKIRIQMHDSQEYQVLRSIISSIYSPQGIENDCEKQSFRIKKMTQLITIANQGRNIAIVALGQLLLNKIITIQMIQTIPSQQQQNAQNPPNQTNKNDIMKIIKFPQQNEHNQGWLALIRILVNLNYCTQEMILYCIRTIAKNKSLQSVEFSLQILYILVIDKRMVRIQDVIVMLGGGEILLTNDKLPGQKLLVYNFFGSLMKFSLPSTVLEVSHQIRYCATKILSRCFSTQEVLENTILTNIPLSNLTQFIDEKFITKSTWQRTKSLQLINDLLNSLKNFTLYKADQIINQTFPLIQKIMHEIYVTSSQMCKKSQGQLGYSHTFSQSTHQSRHDKDLIKFIQQSVYFIQILVGNYLFTHNCITLTNILLEKLTFQITLQQLYNCFAKEVRELKNAQTQNQQQRFMWSLTNQQQAKVWIFQNLLQITVNFYEKIISSSQNLQLNHSNLNQEDVDKFLTLSKLILSRLNESQIISAIHQQNQEKQYEI